MAKFFGVLASITILYIIGLLFAFIFGDGKISNNISPYVFAILITLPALFFSYLVNSKLDVVKNDKGKVHWFMITVVGLCIIIGFMYITWINEAIWWGLKKLPNYEKVRSLYPGTFAPAIKTICLVGPFVCIFYLIDYLTMILREEDYSKGIAGFCGLNVSKPIDNVGPFSCETVICRDPKTAEEVVVPEKKRMEATLVQGATGTGKTATVLLPMSARDI